MRERKISKRIGRVFDHSYFLINRLAGNYPKLNSSEITVQLWINICSLSGKKCMNKLKYLFILSFFIISCKKDGQEPSVAGNWEWFKATGGIANIYLTPQNSGHSWYLKLNANYTSFQTGDLFTGGEGTYTLTEDTNPNWPRRLLNITTHGATLTFAYSFITNDTLRLDENIEADGLSYFLVRQ